MDRNDLFELLDTIPNNISIMLMGKHGVGKSEIIKQYAESRGIDYVCMILTQRTDGDFVGIPCKIEINGKTYSSFAPPDIFARISTGKGILCLDELPDAAPDIRNAAQELIQARALNEVKAGEGWRFIAAGNPAGTTAYVTGDLRPQLVSRFLWLNFQPSHEEVLQYFREKNVHPAVTSFLEKNNMCLFPPDELEMNKQYPCPRQYQRMSEIFNSNDKMINSKYRFEIAAGCIGFNTGGMFDKFVAEEFHIFRAEDILEGNIRGVNWTDIPQLSGAASELSVFKTKDLNAQQMKSLKKFVLKCPREVQITYFRKYVSNRRVDEKRLNGETIVDLIGKNNAMKDAIFDGNDMIKIMDGIKELSFKEDEIKDEKADEKTEKKSKK